MVMDVRSGMRATLLAITFLWVGTSLPHIYSSTRAFFLESLPSILTAAMEPKCLFVFSNIIVVILVSESKLSRRRGEGFGAEEEQECAAIQELQETDLPTADELNRRVEDFIARFNMERQLEAKMLVPCY
ncbi:hypothetical protein QOZ80_5AG0389600 [Eleusine coracana subsp. coracana]|nr:hypothetical protein QOZ80_5AG0389600 [Eleusine coracana subsp. coracana]